MATQKKLRSELLKKSGKFDLSAFNLDNSLTRLCYKQLQSMREHLRPVHECKLGEESSKKRDEFVDATTSSLLRLLQLPSVSSGSVASLLSSVQNSALRLEEEDDKMLRLIESSGAGIIFFLVCFRITCAVVLACFQRPFRIGARIYVDIQCKYI